MISTEELKIVQNLIGEIMKEYPEVNCLIYPKRGVVGDGVEVDVPEEIVVEKKKLKKASQPDLRKINKKYPDEMIDFILENLDSNSNSELAELINKKFNVGINKGKLAAFMQYNNLRRSVKVKKEKKVVKKDPYDLKINEEPVDKKVLEFIEKRKDWDDYVRLRDEVIMVFEKNFSIAELKAMQKHFQKNKLNVLPGDGE